MKLVFILPITFSLLTACAPEKSEYVFEGPSTPVSVDIASSENEEPTLPPQISVSLEKTIPKWKSLRVQALESFFQSLLYSENTDSLSFGCDDGSTEEIELPSKVDAGNVVLCGKIKIPANGFEMRATNLELRDVALTATSSDNQIHLVSISTAYLTVTGSNKLVLQGSTKGRERKAAPALFLKIATVTGAGTLEILSRSYITVINPK
ncbi:hypothetical protein D3C87_1093480 [compost metagenome]